uniref:Uncharacterized protein n=1 Tax=Arundo donax TaxID=35708 RepID=A0A0A9CF47_ARUDO
MVSYVQCSVHENTLCLCLITLWIVAMLCSGCITSFFSDYLMDGCHVATWHEC